MLAKKVAVEIFVLTRVLFVSTILTIALLKEIQQTPLKVETRTKQSCKVLIVNIMKFESDVFHI